MLESNFEYKHYWVEQKVLLRDVMKMATIVKILENKKDIIKSMILSRISKIEETFNARDMVIGVPTSEEKTVFLRDNHLQGPDKSSIY